MMDNNLIRLRLVELVDVIPMRVVGDKLQWQTDAF